MRMRSVGQPRRANAVAAPVPHSSVTTSPPMRWLLRPKRLTATDGPSDRYSPPSAQLATMIGTIANTSARMRTGMPTRGCSDARAPARRAEVSGRRVTTAAATQHAGQQQRVDEMRRRRRELHERAAAQRAERQAAERRDAVDQARAARGVRRVEVDERRPERRERRAGGDALRDARDRQPGDAVGDDEQHERDGLQRDRRGQHGAPADVV